MAPTSIESRCPRCYHQLPSPASLLGPHDETLNYMMWMPGFEWTPLPVIIDKTVEQGEEDHHETTETDMQEALLELVEEDELKKKFQEISDGDQTTPQKAAVLARQLGLSPSLMDIEEFEKQQGNAMNYTAFQNFCAICTHPDDKPDVMATNMSAFDISKCGYLTKKQLRNILTTHGEPLSEEEVNAAFK
ncbi:myosin light chain MLC1 [Cardiosporidium cionae]|uniref:Myosin light chain MLC1 n=1 Tax=Cardiosporidium cionae TaxID=476202 RepID=A0ABQ7JAG1_9APIC|nr:myosin light chain MLC1 [Cardiosporidium cionae]|eukprot:KAF8820645.1 myosin light chain MLC1 [Cardiosporidium cionae]